MFKILGMWSEISCKTTQQSKLVCNFWLMNILSIRVAVVLVILVGLVIQGYKLLSKFTSRKSWVSLCSCALSRLRLWSIPNIISLWFSFCKFCISFLYCLMNSDDLVFGRRYKDPNIMVL